MAIAIVQTGTGSGSVSASATLLSATMGAAPISGNLLLGFASGGDNATTGGTGYTSIKNEAAGNPQTQCSYKIAGASESTTQSWASSGTTTTQYFTAQCLELSGVASSSQINGSIGSAPSASGQTYTGPSLTPTAAGAVFTSFAFDDYNGITGASISSGWTLLGPYAGGASGSYSSRVYIAYNLNAVSGIAYAPILTITGTAQGGSPACITVAIAQGVATGPIVQVGTAGGTYSAANTLLPVTMSSAPVNGNLLIGFAGGYRAVSYAGTYTSPLTNLNTTSNSVTFGYRYAGTSESTTQTQAQTNSATAAYYEAIVLEVSGLAPVNAFQNYATLVVTGASNVFTGASITPNMPGMLFAEFAFTDATGGITGASINSPWTLLGPYIQDGGAAYSTSDAAVTVYVAYMSVTSALVGVAQTPTMTVTGTPHSNVAGNVVASFASSAPFTRKAMFRQVTAGSRKGLTNAA